MEPRAEYQAGQQEKLDQWSIVELFGHSRIAGRVSEFVIGGSSFVRVDVPEVDDTPAFTRLYGPNAIYSISFVDEETARRAVKAIKPAPITIYIPSLRPVLAAPTEMDRYDPMSWQTISRMTKMRVRYEPTAY